MSQPEYDDVKSTTHERSSPPASGAGPSAAGASRGGLKAALRTASYEEGAAMLAPVQRKGGAGDDSKDVHAAAAAGVSGGGRALPHGDAIQRSFGGYDISQVQAHTDAAAQGAAASIGADAYATGHHVAFGKTPDLHTAAHEAAHVVQQDAGVSLSGGVGKAGDGYEKHADAVADAVVQGKSAEPLLAGMTGGAGHAGVQMKGGKPKTPKQEPRPDKKPKSTEKFKVKGGRVAGAGDKKSPTTQDATETTTPTGPSSEDILNGLIAESEASRKKAKLELQQIGATHGIAASPAAVEHILDALGEPDSVRLKMEFGAGFDAAALTDKQLEAKKWAIGQKLARDGKNRALWDKVAAGVDFSTPPSGAVFWSGWPWAQHAAMNFPGPKAESGIFAALEQTAAGRLFNLAEHIRGSYGIGTTNMWPAFSARLAQLTTGKINVVLAAWRPDTIYEQEEYPQLRAKLSEGGATGWQKSIVYHRVIPKTPGDRSPDKAGDYTWGGKVTDDGRAVLGTWLLPSDQDGKMGEGRDSESDKVLKADVSARLGNLGDDQGLDALKATPNVWLQFALLTCKLGPSDVVVSASGGAKTNTGERPALDVYKAIPPTKQAKFLYEAAAARQPTLVLFLLKRIEDEAVLDAMEGTSAETKDGAAADPLNQELYAALMNRMLQAGAAAQELAILLGVPTKEEIDAAPADKPLKSPAQRAASVGQCAGTIRGRVGGGDIGGLEALGQASWEILVLGRNAKTKEEPYVKHMGQATWDAAVEFYNNGQVAREKALAAENPKISPWSPEMGQLKTKDKAWVAARDRVEVLRAFAMPWAEATASLGMDPRGNIITDTLSVRGTDYGAKFAVDGGEQTGEQILGSYGDDLKKADTNVHVWSDMYLPWPMWSMAGNLSRYMDTNVHLFGAEKGSALIRDKKEGGKAVEADATVTNLEVFTGKSQKTIDKNKQVQEHMVNHDDFNGVPGGDVKKILTVSPGGFEYREDGTVTRDGKVVKAGPGAAIYVELTSVKGSGGSKPKKKFKGRK